MFRTLALVFSAALTLAAAGNAQALSTALSGRVIVAPAMACDPTATHAIECGDILLKSSTIDLTQFEGQNVDLTGDVDLLAPCTVFDVTEIDAGTNVLRASSFTNFRIGSTFLITSTEPIGSLVIRFFSGMADATALGPFGTYQLCLLDSVTWATDLSIGLSFKNISIPNDPTMVGMTPHFQQLVISLTNPLESRLTNSVCFTVRG